MCVHERVIGIKILRFCFNIHVLPIRTVCCILCVYSVCTSFLSQNPYIDNIVYSVYIVIHDCQTSTQYCTLSCVIV